LSIGYYEKHYRGSFEKKMRKLLSLAKARAKKKGLEFCITAEDLIHATHCPLLNIPLDFDKRGKGTNPESPSIDRIDPNEGYVPVNVWVVSAKANRMKSDATLEELELLVENLRIAMGHY
jgi:hypothetical protein